MSKWIIFCLVLCLLGTGADAQSIYNRKYLVAGQTVDMTYNPAGTPLENAKDVKAIVYLWRDYVWEADEVDMTWRDTCWTGSYRIPLGTALLCPVSGAVKSLTKEDKILMRKWYLIRQPDSNILADMSAGVSCVIRCYRQLTGFRSFVMPITVSVMT